MSNFTGGDCLLAYKIKDPFVQAYYIETGLLVTYSSLMSHLGSATLKPLLAMSKYLFQYLNLKTMVIIFSSFFVVVYSESYHQFKVCSRLVK